MTFNPSVPNPAQSPGLFPTQNSNNFARLKTIINADHVFNDSSQTTDGVHRQVTLISRAPPGSLPAGTNSLLYSWIDGIGRSQLRFYNGATDIQLTPPEELLPIRVVGAASINAGQTAIAYADPGFRWVGTGWAIINLTNVFRNYTILRSGLNDLHELDSNSGAVSRPNFEFSGDNLLIRNNSGSTQICVWSLIINRIF